MVQISTSLCVNDHTLIQLHVLLLGKEETILGLNSIVWKLVLTNVIPF